MRLVQVVPRGAPLWLLARNSLFLPSEEELLHAKLAAICCLRLASDPSDSVYSGCKCLAAKFGIKISRFQYTILNPLYTSASNVVVVSRTRPFAEPIHANTFGRTSRKTVK